MIESPIYTVNRASTSQVIQHLETCNENFMPPLSDRVNIKEYSLKLTRIGMRFEAWADETLVGLVAAYCNNAHDSPAFITNVSVELPHQGQGVARRLLTNCKSYSEENFFQCIQLEVNSRNSAALSLYQDEGFIISGSRDDMLTMSCKLRSDR